MTNAENTTLSLGIDFGTSGARAMAIAADGAICMTAMVSFPAMTVNWATTWRSALFHLIEEIPLNIRQQLGAIAINGTSSTVLLCDTEGEPVTAPILYNDDRGVSVLGTLNAIAPPNHPAISATSSLAKLLWWCCDAAVNDCIDMRTNASSLESYYFLHQADWLGFLLHGQLGISDYHNALKLGYDPESLSYPDWMKTLPSAPHLPKVLTPGTPIGSIEPDIVERYGLPGHCTVCAGTTDSIAAFLASGVRTPGEAVTSLGSTLVLKLLSQTRVDDGRYGIYSHRLGDRWLVGGASNTGGAVLRQYFCDRDLSELSQQIDPRQVSPLHYYPLLQPGERFPINDPHLPPQLNPRPDDPVTFLHGLLESIARVETEGYRLLETLSATPLTQVYTAGGGAANPTWTAIRARRLQVPVMAAPQTAAAYGTAQLAQLNWAATATTDL